MAGNERTPLLAASGDSISIDDNGNSNGNGNGNGNGNSYTKQTTFFGPANRILLAGFLMSFTLGITQVPWTTRSDKKDRLRLPPHGM
ncbi:hypothetical protein O1611_g2144 [Lasiodiplodia mahajangana]|uniref:Uncharacterized protein n=1 Tax=Lasiodiplodia mahajangana TaxID=1108764 RepID=A0ACC2JVY2_9PEZI|nr:hypothetical protein O1611_g2144 [Lasiodiplodia mahajangana]